MKRAASLLAQGTRQVKKGYGDYTTMTIKFNTEMHRWEVYHDNCVVRAGEIQPAFVSRSFEACVKYVEDCLV